MIMRRVYKGATFKQFHRKDEQPINDIKENVQFRNVNLLRFR